MSDPRFEELASLHSLGLLDAAGQTELLVATENDPAVRRLVREFSETASALAFEAPQVQPPDGLKRSLLRQLPAKARKSKIIAFPSWIPFAIAACLMALAIYQTRQMLDLKAQLTAAKTDVSRLSQSNTLLGLRLTELESQNPYYMSAKVVVAWDAKQHRGVISMQNLPAPTAGHDYQLWVLDPQSAAPLSAGVIQTEAGSRPFASRPLSTTTPGFAISLEPKGGSASPTTGSVLFAVAPGT